MQQLLNKLNSIRPLSPELQLHLKDKIKYKEYPKGSFLLEPGQVCENICFIQQGLVRVYYENADIEICPWLLIEGDIAISVVSYFNQVSSFEFIQALEDTIVYYITYDELEFIYDKFPEFNFVGRKLLQHYYALESKRLFSILGKSADARYAYLLEFYAHLILRIAGKHQAAYLGMDPATFSRIKAKYLREQKLFFFLVILVALLGLTFG
ncbi:hypothetical protein A3860_38825 [Niastella vici]|uniref:Cyclic nucleotide-binding domain-containing protein n=1 Tax=Niastella vici TaxID=1703345 RepID=A0A1V9FLJ3_9BACT|nr:Crp/Fnr family transcriptional regulator [Niastella vici]OQP59126.1 hypothetical protein A3860_38825 [Niastella vici]